MLRIEGLAEVRRYLNRVAENTNPAVASALKAESELLLANTLPVTPIEFGPLRASGRTSSPVNASNSINVEVSFGGPAAPYALYVHERVIDRRSGKSIFHQDPTKAKFLESTAESTFPQMMAGIWARTLAVFMEKK